MQPKAASPRLPERAPHAATVAQRREPHPATVMQAKPASFWPAQRSPATRAVQRAEDPDLKKDERPKLYPMSPGVAVLLLKDIPSTEKYVELIAGLIKTISATTVGAELLNEFDPANKSNTFPQVDGGADSGPSKGMYQDIRMVICPVTPKRGKVNPLFTGEFSGTSAETGKVYFGDRSMQIPKVNFWDATLATFDNGAKVITAKGIEKYPDLDKGVWPLDVPLFHEMCHAYLFSTAITEALLDSTGRQEEYLVTGLDQGIGWRYSENTYRGQRGENPRTSYLDLGIKSPEAGEFAWGDNDVPLKSIAKTMGLKSTPWTERTKRW